MLRFDVCGVPLGFAPHIKNLRSFSLQGIVQVLHRDLRHFSERKSRLLPGGHSALQISGDTFNAHSASRSRASDNCSGLSAINIGQSKGLELFPPRRQTVPTAQC